jgi:hypothetical protein
MTQLGVYERVIKIMTMYDTFDPMETILVTTQLSHIKEPEELNELFQSFPKNLLDKLWNTIINSINIIFETKYFLQENLTKEQQTQVFNFFIFNDLQSTQEMLFLRQITLVCECFLKNNKETPSPKLYEILRELHGKRF